ncbi:MAG TPA: hypothetical protein VMB91_04275 [Solirubrobacteraceae bacterium]|nr:hypothetical protein [Solirubrobacteraceae bacterium]
MSNDYRTAGKTWPGAGLPPIVDGHVGETADRAEAAEIRRVGLCVTCVNRREVPNSRGSVFYLCQLSKSDPTFPRYPRLPVLSCPGYRHQR